MSDLAYSEMQNLIDAARCLRCGDEDENAGHGGWSCCFTVCDDCWGKPIDDGRNVLSVRDDGGKE